MANQDRLSQIYSALKGRNMFASDYTEDKFREEMKSDNHRKAFYDFMTNNGVNLSDYDDFSAVVSFPNLSPKDANAEYKKQLQQNKQAETPKVTMADVSAQNPTAMADNAMRAAGVNVNQQAQQVEPQQPIQQNAPRMPMPFATSYTPTNDAYYRQHRPNTGYEALSNEELESAVDRFDKLGSNAKEQKLKEINAYNAEHPFVSALSASNSNDPYGTPDQLSAMQDQPNDFFLSPDDKKAYSAIRQELGYRRFLDVTKNGNERQRAIKANIDAIDELEDAGKIGKTYASGAKYLYEKAGELYGMNSSYGDTNGFENWWQGTKNNLFDRQVLATPELVRDVRLDKIITKLNKAGNSQDPRTILNEEEAALLDAYMTYGDAQDFRQYDKPLGYTIGEGTAVSVPFMVDMLATHGLASAGKRALLTYIVRASKAAEAAGNAERAAKLMARADKFGRFMGGAEGVSVEANLSDVNKGAAKGLIRDVYGSSNLNNLVAGASGTKIGRALKLDKAVVNGGDNVFRTAAGAVKEGENFGTMSKVGNYLAREAVETPLQTFAMPTSWDMVLDDKIQQNIAHYEDPAHNDEYGTLDFLRSLGNAYVETFTERAGGKLIETGLNKILPWHSIWSHKAGRAMAANSYIQSPLSETAEEYLGAGINYLRSLNPLYSDESNEKMRAEAKQMFTPEGFAQTFGTVLPMSLAGGALNSGRVWWSGHNYNNMRDKLGKLLVSRGATQEQAENIMLDLEYCKDPKEFAEKCQTFADNMVRMGESRKKMDELLGGYMRSMFQYQHNVQDFHDEMEKLSPEEKAKLEQEFKDMKKTLTMKQGESAANEEAAKVAHTDGNVYEVKIEGDDDNTYFVKDGAFKVEPDKNGVPHIILGQTDNEVRVQGKDGNPRYVQAGSLSLVNTAASADYANAINERKAQQAEMEDMFPIGDEVYQVGEDGNVIPDAQPSHVVSVNADGVTITTAEGTTTTIPLDGAAAVLKTGSQFRREQREASAQAEQVEGEWVNADNQKVTITKNEDGTYSMDGAILPDGITPYDLRNDLKLHKEGEDAAPLTEQNVANAPANQSQKVAAPQQTQSAAELTDQFLAKNGDKAEAQLATDIAYASDKLAKTTKALEKATADVEKIPSDDILEADARAMTDANSKRTKLKAAQDEVAKWQSILDKKNAISAEIEARKNAAQTAETPVAEEVPAAEENAPQNEENAAVEEQAAPQAEQEQQPKQKAYGNKTPVRDPNSERGKQINRAITMEINILAEKLHKKIRVVNDESELGGRVQDAAALIMDKNGKLVEGWRDDDGTVTIIANNVQDIERAGELVFHEAVTHDGLLNLLGRDKFNALCDRVYNGFNANGKEAMVAYAYDESPKTRRALFGENAPALYENLTVEQKQKALNNKTLQLIGAEEYIAMMAEMYKSQGRDNNTFKNKWNTLKEDVRLAFHKLLGRPVNITNEEVFRTIEASMTAMKNGNNDEARKEAEKKFMLDVILKEGNTEGGENEGAKASVVTDIEVANMMDSKSPNVSFNENGEVVAQQGNDGVTRFSVRTWDESGRNALVSFLNKKVASGEFGREDADNLLSEMDRLTGMAKEYADGNPESLFGQWSYELVRMKDGTRVPVMHALKDNAEYQLNIDFSSVCKKRQAVDYLMNQIIRDGKLQHEDLSDVDIARINQIIQKHGLEIACGICFVDSRRYNAYTFANGFLNKYNPIILSLAPQLGENGIAGFNYSNDSKFTNEGKTDLTQVNEVVDWSEVFRLDGDNVKALDKYKLNWRGVYNILKARYDSAREFMQSNDFESKFQDGWWSANKDDIIAEYVDEEHKAGRKASKSKVATEIRTNKELLNKLKSRLPKATEQDRFNWAVRKKNPDAEQRMAMDISQKPNLRKLAKAEDFIASEGWVNVMQSNEDLETLWNVQKGAAGARANESNVQYQSDVLEKDVLGDIFDIAGYRMQSFSDFIGRMYFDYLQAFADLSARQLPGHAYTKEPSFVKLFGMMGIKINMSLVCDVDKSLGKDYAGLTRDANGNLVYNIYETVRDKDGNIITQGQTFPSAIAYQLQEDPRYTKNVGTIAVGLSREHIRMMLRDPRIRMVIPYHKSGLPHGVALVYKLNEVNDYTDQQNTTNNGNSRYKGDKKLLHHELDQYNFILHQLSIAEDKKAAYNAIMDIYVDGNFPEDYHAAYEERYKMYADAKQYRVDYDFDGCEMRENDNFLPKVAADLYLAACQTHKAHPKFEEFTDEHDYYKVLIDFAVYDKDGRYTPQEAIKFQVPENADEYIKETLTEDENIDAKRVAETEGIAKEVEAYLDNKKLRKKQDSIAKKKDEKVTAEDLKLMGANIYNVGDVNEQYMWQKMYDKKLGDGETYVGQNEGTRFSIGNNESLLDFAKRVRESQNVQRDALIRLGVKIGEPTKDNAGNAAIPAYEEWRDSNPTDPNGGTRFSIANEKYNVDENIERGLDALRSLADGEESVKNAMFRNELEQFGGTSGITFDFGTAPILKDGRLVKGSGFQKIVAKHGAEEAVQVVKTIANGSMSTPYGPEYGKRVDIVNEDRSVTISLYRNKVSESWVLTGFKIEPNTDAKGRGSDLDNAMQLDPIRTRELLGAVLNSPAKLQQIFGNSKSFYEKNSKQRQFDIISQTNPADETLSDHAWIRSVDDIKTFEEAVNDERATTPDFTDADIDKALETGKVRVFSSHPIENGAFVTPSEMEAQNYAGEGKVYSEEVSTKDVAWLDTLQGQLAREEEPTDPNGGNKYDTDYNDGTRFSVLDLDFPKGTTEEEKRIIDENLHEYLAVEPVRKTFRVIEPYIYKVLEDVDAYNDKVNLRNKLVERYKDARNKRYNIKSSDKNYIENKEWQRLDEEVERLNKEIKSLPSSMITKMRNEYGKYHDDMDHAIENSGILDNTKFKSVGKVNVLEPEIVDWLKAHGWDGKDNNVYATEFGFVSHRVVHHPKVTNQQYVTALQECLSNAQYALTTKKQPNSLNLVYKGDDGIYYTTIINVNRHGSGGIEQSTIFAEKEMPYKKEEISLVWHQDNAHHQEALELVSNDRVVSGDKITTNFSNDQIFEQKNVENSDFSAYKDNEGLDFKGLEGYGIRFSVVTPAEDKAYADAVERGDMETAAEMVKAAAKKAGYTYEAYHGAEVGGFNTFDNTNRKKTNSVDGAYHFFVDKDNAATYSGEDGQIYHTFLKMNNPFVYEANGENWDEISLEFEAEDGTKFDTLEEAREYSVANKQDPALVSVSKGGTTNDLVRIAKDKGYDSVIFKNIYDGGYNIYDTMLGAYPTDEYVVLSPSQIKSADPATYDDNGDLIPLSERFNEENDDIRFSVADEFVERANDYESGEALSKQGVIDRVEDLAFSDDMDGVDGIEDVRNAIQTYRNAQDLDGEFGQRGTDLQEVEDNTYEAIRNLAARINDEGTRFSVADYNRGYTTRDNGQNISVRASEAEEEGSFSRGNFAKTYGISLNMFDILNDLGLIKKTEWHHTGSKFNETDFYSWSDSSRAGGNVDYFEGQIPEGSIADVVKEKYGKLKSLLKESEGKDYSWSLASRSIIQPLSKEDWWDGLLYGTELSEEEQQSLEEEQRNISSMSDKYTSSERRIMHQDADYKWHDIARNRAHSIDEYDAYVEEVLKSNETNKAHNDNLKSSNLSLNSKESFLMKIAEELGFNDAYEKVLSLARGNAFHNKMSVQSAIVERYDKEKSAIFNKLDIAKKKWLEKQVENGNAKFVEREPIRPNELFAVTKEEQNGRYGWYEANGRYGSKIYYTGYQLASGKLKKQYDALGDKYFKKIDELRAKESDELNAIRELSEDDFRSSNDEGTRFSVARPNFYKDSEDYENNILKSGRELTEEEKNEYYRLNYEDWKKEKAWNKANPTQVDEEPKFDLESREGLEDYLNDAKSFRELAKRLMDAMDHGYGDFLVSNESSVVFELRNALEDGRFEDDEDTELISNFIDEYDRYTREYYDEWGARFENPAEEYFKDFMEGYVGNNEGARFSVADPELREEINEGNYEERMARYLGEQTADVSVELEDPTAYDTAIETLMNAVGNAADINFKYLASLMNSLKNRIESMKTVEDLTRSADRLSARNMRNIAKMFISKGWADGISRGELTRILSAISKTPTKSAEEIKRLYGDLVDALAMAQTRKMEGLWKQSIKPVSKLNQSGVQIAKGVMSDQAQVINAVTAFLKQDSSTYFTKEGELQEKIADETLSPARRHEYENELAALHIATQYVTDVATLKSDIRDLEHEIIDAKDAIKGKTGEDRKARKEYIRSLEDEIRSERLQLAGNLAQLTARMADLRKEGNNAYRAWVEAKQAHKSEIIHNAMSDLEGVEPIAFRRRESTERETMRKLLDTLDSPTHTFLFELKKYAKHAADGQGYLYQRFGYGLIEASENEWNGRKVARQMLDSKAKELFGRDYVHAMNKYADKPLAVPISIANKTSSKESEVTIGQAMYIYQVNKMTDGKMKLRKENISEADVEALTESLRQTMDGKFIEMADWMQNEFLPSLRNKYSATYQRIYGCPMPEVAHYVPLKIAKTDINQNVDLADKDGDRLPSSIVGNIIKRTVNTKAIDIENTNAFELMLEHVGTMEHWNAYAEVIQDINTLLSNRTFRNKIENLYTGNFEKFKTLAQIAVSAYKPNDAGKGISDAIKMVNGSKVSIRFQTALKQIASFPAFLDEAGDPKFLGRFVANGNPVSLGKNVAWCFENLPLMEKRWLSRAIGDEKLDFTDIKMAKGLKKVVDVCQKYGMLVNSSVDLVTCCLGAKTMYDYKLAQYKSRGYDDAECERRARLDAEIFYNETQQSSEGLMMSKIQSDKDWFSTCVSLYNNSSFAYNRKIREGMKNAWKFINPKTKISDLVSFREKQLVRDGVKPELAHELARKDVIHSASKALLDFAIFGYGIQFFWNMFGDMYSGIGHIIGWMAGGGDPDKDEDYWKDIAIKSAIQPIRGYVFGASSENLLKAIRDNKTGNSTFKDSGLEFMAKQSAPVVQDLANLFDELMKDDDKRDAMKVVNLVLRSASSAITGVDSQTFANEVAGIVYPIYDLVEGSNGKITWQDVYLDLGLFMNTAQSQTKLYALKRREGESTQSMIDRYTRFKRLQTYGVYGAITPGGEDYKLTKRQRSNAIKDSKELEPKSK